MPNKTRRAGRWVLAAGLLLLVAAIVIAFTIGTIAAQILFALSILTNTVAVLLLRKKPPRRG